MGDLDTVWLASKSPRRAQLLREVFPNIICQGIEGVDEKPPLGEVEYQVLETVSYTHLTLPTLLLV